MLDSHSARPGVIADIPKPREPGPLVGIRLVRRRGGGWSLSRSDRKDPTEKDRLKPLTPEPFLVDRMFPSGREMH
jgi:hypothetical protein